MSTATADLRVREADGEALGLGRACASHAISGASSESQPNKQESDDEASSAAREARALPEPAAIRYARHRLPHFERPWGKYAIAFTTLERQVLVPAERDLVLESVLYGFKHGQYHLYVACVMPDHVHFLIEPQPKHEGKQGETIFWALREILRGIRSTTAHRINKRREQTGRVWEDDFFDRYARSESDLQEKFRYICENPWRGGIVNAHENYPWLWTPEVGLGRARAWHAISGASSESQPNKQESDDEASSAAREARALPRL